MGVTQRRRQADLDRLRGLIAANPGKIELRDVKGDPPSVISLRFHCRSVSALNPTSGPTYGSTHDLRIQLGERYPLEQPLVYVESPISNPHVFPNTRRICLGEAWIPSEMMDVFVQRLWSIIVWDPRVIDPSSPANMEALRWFEANRSLLPLAPPDLHSAGTDAPPPKPRLVWRSQ